VQQFFYQIPEDEWLVFFADQKQCGFNRAVELVF
jgi:hypothetical protein